MLIECPGCKARYYIPRFKRPSLWICKACGEKISILEVLCPNCGHKQYGNHRCEVCRIRLRQ